MRAATALLALLAVAPAFGAELSLPCHGPDGSADLEPLAAYPRWFER